MTVEKQPKEYLRELDEAIAEDRETHGRKPLPPKDKDDDKDNTKEIKSSTTDPDSGYLTREGKPQGFYYLDHRTVDEKCNFVTDIFVSAANQNDSVPYLSRLKHQIELFGFEVLAVGLDAGYYTHYICKRLIEQGIAGVIGYRRPSGKKGLMKKRKFKYNTENDVHICPNNEELRYRTTNRSGFREYASNPKKCINCPFLDKCTNSKNNLKIVSRHVWEDYRETIEYYRLMFYGKEIYKRRKKTIERSFANAKQLHGYRYAKYRGLERVKEQSYMTAIVQNIKKMVKFKDKSSLFTYFYEIYLKIVNYSQFKLIIMR